MGEVLTVWWLVSVACVFVHSVDLCRSQRCCVLDRPSAGHIVYRLLMNKKHNIISNMFGVSDLKYL